jgi:C4-dicarboxylate transporter DctM subunit
MIAQASVGLVVFLGLLGIGIPIYIALIAVPAGLILIGGGSLAGIGQHILDDLNSPTLMAVPFFMMAAVFMQGGGVAKALIDMSMAYLGRFRAGLPLAAVLSTALFAAINGSSVATALAMGTLVVPAMIERGYERSFALGLTAAAGTLGILIPPSMPLVLYGLVTESSIPRLFLAGVVPGLLQAAIFCLYVAVTAGRHGGRTEPFPGWRAFGRRNVAAIPALAIPVVVLGGIYGGFVTVTEAAALSALLAIVAGFIYRAASLSAFPAMLRDSIDRTAAVVIMVAGATLLSAWLTESRLANDLVEVVVGLDMQWWQFLLVMNVILLILGTVLEGIAMILITVPLTLPILHQFGISPIHYAIIVTINVELAALSPPIGLNLFVMAQVADAPVKEVTRGVIPFAILMLVLLMLVTFIPALSTFLPNLVLGVEK